MIGIKYDKDGREYPTPMRPEEIAPGTWAKPLVPYYIKPAVPLDLESKKFSTEATTASYETPQPHPSDIEGFDMSDLLPGPYETLGNEIGKLVEEKQAAYGDSFGKAGAVMKIMYPDGIPVDKIDDALAVVRILDKLFRIATDKDALGESPYRDIAGYGLLGARRATK